MMDVQQLNEAHQAFIDVLQCIHYLHRSRFDSGLSTSNQTTTLRRLPSAASKENAAEEVFEEGDAPKQAQTIHRIRANLLFKIDRPTEAWPVILTSLGIHHYL